VNYARRRVAEDVAADLVEEVLLVAWRRLWEIPSETHPLNGITRAQGIAGRHGLMFAPDPAMKKH
jgi:hypothetical protein